MYKQAKTHIEQAEMYFKLNNLDQALKLYIIGIGKYIELYKQDKNMKRKFEAGKEIDKLLDMAETIKCMMKMEDPPNDLSEKLGEMTL